MRSILEAPEGAAGVLRAYAARLGEAHVAATVSTQYFRFDKRRSHGFKTSMPKLTTRMSLRTTLTPWSPEAHAAVLAEYNHATDPRSRTCIQMILPAVERDLSPRQFAPLVHRSHDTVPTPG
jgi:hypothetical protein